MKARISATVENGYGASDVRRIINQSKSKKQAIRRLSAELIQKHHLLNVFYGYGQAAASASSEKELYSQFCDFAVKQGGYLLVWVGLKRDDQYQTVEPVAWAGTGSDYLRELSVDWSERGKSAQGPTGKAIRSGQSHFCRNMAVDPAFRTWRTKSGCFRFASSLAIPIKEGQTVCGAINFHSGVANAFHPMEVDHLERITAQISLWVRFFRESDRALRLDELNRRALESRTAISALLEASLRDLDTNSLLLAALQVILSVPWLSLESKGSIFLADPSTRTLRMAAQYRMAAILLDRCRTIPYGYCLCGRAAEQRHILFTDRVDEHHEVTFDGLQPHGHYCVPIISNDTLLGVLNLYVAQGHIPTSGEQEFLSMVGNTLAGIIERKAIEVELHQQARFDSLTGLLNRRSFHDEMNREILRARRENKVFALLYIDLDGFKRVNDINGHPVGDEVLRMAAVRIAASVRGSDTVARLGGDEFGVLLVGLIDENDTLAVANKIVEQIGKRFIVGGVNCHIGCSIGISLYPAHGTSLEEMVRCADAALYAAKRGGRNCFRIYPL
ncbi:MAG: diguanylate cyclase [Magnetococcales bacterium]|nr:diguanylate cyclase [Magnetococcales bacterium]